MFSPFSTTKIIKSFEICKGFFKNVSLVGFYPPLGSDKQKRQVFVDLPRVV